MKILYRHGDFCTIKTSPVFRKHPFSGQVEEKFPSIDILHDKTESVMCLERVLQGLQKNDKDSRVGTVLTHSKEGMVCHLQHSVFSQCMGNLIFSHYDILFEYFHGHDLPCLLVFAHNNLHKIIQHGGNRFEYAQHSMHNNFKLLT